MCLHNTNKFDQIDDQQTDAWFLNLIIQVINGVFA